MTPHSGASFSVTSSAVVDHYAVSPLGLFPDRVVVRVLAYQPRVASWPGLRLRVQAVLPHGEPIAEDPLLATEGVSEGELQEFLDASERDGWTFMPCVSPSRVSS